MISDIQRQYEEDRRRTVARVVSQILRHINADFVIDLNSIGRHPIATVVYKEAIRGGTAARGVVEEGCRALIVRSSKDFPRLRNGHLIAIQSSLVLPERETRNAALTPASIDELALEEKLDGFAAALLACLPEWWPHFVDIVASYTVVEVNGNSAPSRFSGTFSDAAGAVHGAELRDAEMFVETLTHEAGHLWLNLLVNQDAHFIGNHYEDQRFISPWRWDPRPIHGIVHGAYVFSVVVPALLAVGTKSARSRAVQLSVEVEDAVRQILAFGELSLNATEVIAGAQARIVAAESLFSPSELTTARDRYAVEKERKVQQLRGRAFELLVI